MKAHLTLSKEYVLSYLEGEKALLLDAIAGSEEEIDKLNKAILSDPYRDDKIMMHKQSIQAAMADIRIVDKQLMAVKAHKNYEHFDGANEYDMESISVDIEL